MATAVAACFVVRYPVLYSCRSCSVLTLCDNTLAYLCNNATPIHSRVLGRQNNSLRYNENFGQFSFVTRPFSLSI